MGLKYKHLFLHGTAIRLWDSVMGSVVVESEITSQFSAVVAFVLILHLQTVHILIGASCLDFILSLLSYLL
jgi:hypothetical protein